MKNGIQQGGHLARRGSEFGQIQRSEVRRDKRSRVMSRDWMGRVELEVARNGQLFTLKGDTICAHEIRWGMCTLFGTAEPWSRENPALIHTALAGILTWEQLLIQGELADVAQRLTSHERESPSLTQPIFSHQGSVPFWESLSNYKLSGQPGSAS